MLILDTTTKSIEMFLGGAVATNQLPIVVNYVDITTATFTPGASDTISNNTTTVAIVSAPGASTQRQVKYISIYNEDTASVTVTIQLNNSGTLREILVWTLDIGDSLFYIDSDGWTVKDNAGASKIISNMMGPAGGDLSGTYPNPTVSKINGATLGTTTVARGSILVGSATPAWESVALGGAGKIFRSDGTDLLYTTSTFADTYSASSLLYSNGANTVTGLATANNGVLVTSGAGVPSISSTLPSAVQGNITNVGALTSGSLATGFTTVGATLGGTGQSTVTTGDLLYGIGANAWGKLADVATGSVLISGGVGVAPAWSASPTLTTSLTTPLHIGGTGVGSSLELKSTSGAGTTDFIRLTVGNNGAIEALRASTSGKVGIMTGANIFSAASLHVNSDGAANFGLYSSYNAVSAATTASVTLARGRGTLAVPAVTNSADLLGNINFAGQINTTINAISTGIRISGIASETWSGTANGSYLTFNICASTTTALTERWRMANNGNFSNTAADGTAYFHLKANTATASTGAIKFTLPGVVLTTREAGVMETDAERLYYTPTSTARQAFPGVLFTQTADKTVTNTVTETSIIGTGVGSLATAMTLPANFFVAGKTLRLRIGGIYSTPALATPSVVINVKYGATVIATTTTTSLLSGATALEFDGEILITCRTTGAAGTVMVHGDIEYATGIGGTIAVNPLNNAGVATTVNTTTSNLIDVTVTWDTATTTRIATSTVCTLEVLN